MSLLDRLLLKTRHSSPANVPDQDLDESSEEVFDAITNGSLSFSDIGEVNICDSSASRLLPKVNDVLSRAAALSHQGRRAMDGKEYVKGIDFISRSLGIERRLKRKWGMGSDLVNLGQAYMSASKYDDACRCFREGLSIAEEIGWIEGVALHSYGLMNVLIKMGDIAGAEDPARRCVEAYRVCKSQLVDNAEEFYLWIRKKLGKT